MKRITLLLSLFLMAFAAVNAQKSFEGTLEYDMKLMGEGADQVSAFMPTKQIMQFGNGNMTLEMEGGMMAAMMGKVLVQSKENKVFMIKDAEQTAIELVQEDEAEEEEDGPAPEITELDETITIEGYECKKFKVVMDSDAGPVTQYLWVTKDIKLDMPNKKRDGIGNNPLSVDGIEGIPLKIMSTMDMGGMEMTSIMTASKVEAEKFGKDTFKVPKGYDIEKKSAQELFGGMMGN